MRVKVLKWTGCQFKMRNVQNLLCLVHLIWIVKTEADLIMMIIPMTEMTKTKKVYKVLNRNRWDPPAMTTDLSTATSFNYL